MKILVLKTDDWQALYADGSKLYENHTFNVAEELSHLVDDGSVIESIKTEYIEPDDVDSDLDYVSETELDKIAAKYFQEK